MDKDLIQSNSAEQPKFLQKTSLVLSIIALIGLTPFSINNFLHGRIALGLGSMFVLIVLSLNAWSISNRGRFHHWMMLFTFAPSFIFFLSMSIQNQGFIGVFWCYPVVISFYFMLPERKAWWANSAMLLAIIPQVWFIFEKSFAVRITVTLFITSVFSAVFVRVITQQNEKLQKQATTDSLTGVFNRTLLQETLQQAININRRKQLPMTIATLDLDHFKRINDTFGHDAGDTVLYGISSYLKNRLRQTDKVFRVGGEEFLILFYGTDLRDSLEVVEELRSNIALLPLLPEHSVTASIGIATLNANETWREWIKRSDKNLYKAKLKGRNRIIA